MICQENKPRLDAILAGETWVQPKATVGPQRKSCSSSKRGKCANCSDAGTLMMRAIEADTGKPVTCGSCKTYLMSLNRMSSHDHAAIVQKLYAEISWPQSWRVTHGDRDGQRKRIGEIVSGVLASATTACARPKPVRVPGTTRHTGGRKHNFVNIPLIGQPINRDRLQSHIIYHIMPLAGDTEWVWRRHCKWLREIRPQYNGRLIIGIVTPGDGDAWEYCSPEAVKEELQGLGAEFIEAPNDTGNAKNRKRVRQGIGEGVLFPKMLGALQTTDPDQVAFYGHCKGVSRPHATPDSASHIWAEAMFDTVFRNQTEAIAALDTHGVCGSFRMPGGYRDGGPGIGSNWFYSGTFFGIRLADAFRRKWEYMPTHYGCVEQWPRLNFEKNTQSACLFFDNVNNLYDESYWRNTVTPAFDNWKRERYARRHRPGRLIAVTTCNLHASEEIRNDIRTALDSIILHCESDVLVVDDGSPKEYQEYVRGLCDQRGFRFVPLVENGGVSAAKNVCLDKFIEDDRYKYCLLLDDDVKVISGDFESTYTTAMERAGVDILSWHDPVYTGAAAEPEGELLASNHTCGCCVVVSRECVEKTGLYVEMPGKWGHEHCEYYRRASAAFTGVYFDVPNAKDLLRLVSGASVFTKEDKEESLELNRIFLEARNGSVRNTPETPCEMDDADDRTSH